MAERMRRQAGTLGFLFVFLLAPLSASADTVHLLCSNGIRAVVEDLQTEFQRTTGHSLSIACGLSAALKRQIDSGEAFDLAILTAPVIQDLVANGRIARESPTVVARSPIALAVRSGASRPDIRTKEALERTLRASTSITYAGEGAGGVFFVALAQRLGLAEALRPKTVTTNSGPEAAAVLARGDAQLAVLPLSEILPVSGIEALGTFPGDTRGFVTMVAGMSATTSRAAAVKELIAFLSGPSAVPVLKKRGMER